MNVKNTTEVNSAAIVDSLVICGILNRNRTNRALQFAYDPVAEYLAAHWLAKHQSKQGYKAMISRLRQDSSSTFARAFATIEQGPTITKVSNLN